MYLTLTLISAFVLLYSLGSRTIEAWPVNGALVFIAFGFIFGPAGFGWLALSADAEGLSLVAELTLAVVLFSDAASVDMRVLRSNMQLPERLLLAGLPLTIVLGMLVGYALFPGVELLLIALLASMLAPTDAALGKAVISNKAVPEKIRESLNVESGLNDGICVPLIFILLALDAQQATQTETTSLVLTQVAKSLGIGLAAALVVGVSGSYLLRLAKVQRIMDRTWMHLPVVALSILAFSLAQFAGGSGFVATFCGGLLFGQLYKTHKKPLLEEAENIGNLLSLVTWVFFGAAFIGQALPYLTPQVVLYSLLSLTLVRMLPVFISLTGSGLTISEKLFVGWFGPRGLASIVFGVVVFHESLPGNEVILATLACTVVLSVVLHGISANPLAARLARKQA